MSTITLNEQDLRLVSRALESYATRAGRKARQGHGDEWQDLADQADELDAKIWASLDAMRKTVTA